MVVWMRNFMWDAVYWGIYVWYDMLLYVRCCICNILHMIIYAWYWICLIEYMVSCMYYRMHGVTNFAMYMHYCRYGALCLAFHVFLFEWYCVRIIVYVVLCIWYYLTYMWYCMCVLCMWYRIYRIVRARDIGPVL